MNPSQELTLHIWPSKWNLPSIEPSCIAAVFYLQLALPGRFSIRECTNPDVSPSGGSVSTLALLSCALKQLFYIGQLPYLTHGHHVVAPLSSIIKYVAALPPTSIPPVTEGDASSPGFSADVDALLDPSERAQRTAWFAHVESALGDLVVRFFAHRSGLHSKLRQSLRLMRFTHSRKTTLRLRTPHWHLSTKFHSPTTCLTVSVKSTRLALSPADFGLPLGTSLRKSVPSASARRRNPKKRILSKRSKVHFSASG